jgi:hypothetical protein
VVGIRMRADLLPQRDRLQQVEQLPLVFVDALDLHVVERVRLDDDARALAQRGCETRLVQKPRAPDMLDEGLVLGRGLELAQPLGLVEHALAQPPDQQLDQRRVGLVEPAPEGNPVGLVDDARRGRAREIVEDRPAHQFGMQL